ncbi:Bgt-50645 [Blumeria graminis f. sp. tritici]|uniref:Bgt-50645 n=1 Tax=Blumeria graminis f. sp. tritici TaxID=62690 RepID=A0A9X9QCA9_BLUGR|nr:Bgt-50645 [Blumeria graminis f. sp. tritici]
MPCKLLSFFGFNRIIFPSETSPRKIPIQRLSS